MIMDGQENEVERKKRRKPKTIQNSLQFDKIKFIDFGKGEINNIRQDPSQQGEIYPLFLDRNSIKLHKNKVSFLRILNKKMLNSQEDGDHELDSIFTNL
jgi:hypothetical protein